MTYTLLKDAPEDHEAPEFLEYLRANNVVIGENDDWLIIENCKYHTKDKPWYTAFHKLKYTPSFSDIEELGLMYQQFNMTIKSPLKRTVKRFHIHLHI